MVTLEKDSRAGASTFKLVLPEVPESRFAGNLNLQVTSKGPVCYLFRVYWRPEELIRLKVFEDP